jgi:hypothetical protein
MLGRRSSPRQVPTTSTVWLTSVHRGLRSGARTKLAATKMDEGRLWPPPETGDGQVIGVELRGLEPLTPTLPVRIALNLGRRPTASTAVEFLTAQGLLLSPRIVA